MRLVLGIFFAALGTVIGSASASCAEIHVLSYNVRGLPGWLADDQPARRLPEIARRLEPYDIVMMQEDFAFPEVFERLSQWHRWRGPEGTGGAEVYGSGLTVLSRLPGGDARGLTYDSCAGWLGGAMDCFAAKGILMVRLTDDDGLSVDVYTTHLDAGRDEADQQARLAQLEQLASAVEQWSAGRAVVIGGDFNLDWRDKAQRTVLTAMADRLGLQRAALRGAGRKIDHLFVRDGGDVVVEIAEVAEAEGFVLPDGQPLSDHLPLEARLRLSARAAAP